MHAEEGDCGVEVAGWTWVSGSGERSGARKPRPVGTVPSHVSR